MLALVLASPPTPMRTETLPCTGKILISPSRDWADTPGHESAATTAVARTIEEETFTAVSVDGRIRGTSFRRHPEARVSGRRGGHLRRETGSFRAGNGGRCVPDDRSPPPA